ncbi:GMC oxidoreductase [Flavihumibacter solisilvae]|uniref:GMC family oxidoreductase n=1 Tax=Flavihumibacter solisilvae TaxID=1349421 RepID=A0A0C1KTP3_9BACT|nr:GMC family oxidoreductase [Flavihumibacter solisilvae]KIC90766.1 GMC family oxidoreductase [Flavihumibacter solisilvae]
MPGDSLNLNIRSRQQNTYDAIIVGSGISGGWAAKELCEKGLKVLMLERGSPIEHPKYPTAAMDPWDFAHRNQLTKADKEKFYVQSRHYSIREDNKHFYINDQENPYEEIKRFDWVRGNILGGRSLLWARACYRWSDLDFEANLRDGHGVDWPIRYKDIAPWYDYVEKFIGVSGYRDGIPHLPDGEFMPPFEMNMVEKHFREKTEKSYKNRRVIIGRTANLTQPVKGRGQCQTRDLCHRGCPYGAYFSTNASTLPAAHATGNLTVKPYSLVNRILYDESKQRATGVEVIDTQTHKTVEFHARIIFLNAATVATTAILLNSVSDRFPNGLGNGSDQVGRNLMDHHKGLSIVASVDGFEDSYYSGRRPTSIYIPRFANATEKSEGFLRGYHFGGGAYRTRPANDGIGVELKERLSVPGPWQMSLYAFGECLPYTDNRITLNHTKKDPFGRPMIAVDCHFRENEQAMHEDIKRTGKEMLESAGFKNVRVNGKISFPGNANHEMGTARMGRNPKTSVLNSFNQMHEVPNVFITDGSCMTSGSCVNPSLTYMALTARACDHAARELKKMNI